MDAGTESNPYSYSHPRPHLILNYSLKIPRHLPGYLLGNLYFSWEGRNTDDNEVLQITFASPDLILSFLYLFSMKDGNDYNPHFHTVLEMRKNDEYVTFLDDK